MCGDLGREAHESLRSQRVERLPMGLLVRREAAGRGDLAQVRILGVIAKYAAMLVYDPGPDTWTVESEPWRRTRAYERIKDACVHNGRLVVFTGHGGATWAYERATDGSWSSSEYKCDWNALVSESVLLG